MKLDFTFFNMYNDFKHIEKVVNRDSSSQIRYNTASWLCAYFATFFLTVWDCQNY